MVFTAVLIVLQTSLTLRELLKGYLDVCGITDYTFKKTEEPTFHPGRNTEVLLEGKRIGILGEAHPKVLENYELPYKAYLFELDLEALADAADFSKRFEPIPIYPSVLRDLAIVVDEEMQSDMPIEIIYSTGGELVESVRLFDVYVGDQVPEGKRRPCLHDYISFCNETLTDKAVNDLHDKVVKRLNQELGARVKNVV